jgi:hypothetical protein
MEFWNNIIHSAMMGTDKKMIGVQELPADLAEVAALVNEKITTDKEARFLQLAALAFSYRQSGVMPLQKEGVSLAPCPAEEKPYCNMAAMQVLKNILAEESIPLLKFWLAHCSSKNQVVQPELLPALLSAGLQHKTLQPLITDCCGKRGEWLGRFNEPWNFSSNQTNEQRWQTGTPEQRRAVLKEMRISDPALGLEWLQQTWPQEDANTKTSLLEILSENISDNDLPFLESLSTEKSKKVRDEANNLLKQLPGSAVVKQYEELLKRTVSLKKEKALLGLSSKMVLHFQLPAQIEESIFKTGIEKLSSTKEFTDDEYIIFQLIRHVPPVFWEQQLGDSFQNIIGHFQKDETGKKLFPALVLAIKNFNDHQRAIYMMQYSEVFYIDIIPLLPLQQQDHYSNKFFDQHQDTIIGFASEMKTEWSIELTRNIFRHTAKSPYQYTKSFYNQHIHLAPAKIAAELGSFAPQEEYVKNMWNGISDYISKLINLKVNTIQAFNS